MIRRSYLRILIGLIAFAHTRLDSACLYLVDNHGYTPAAMDGGFTTFPAAGHPPVAGPIFALAMLAVGRILGDPHPPAQLTDPFFRSRARRVVVQIWPFPEFRAQETRHRQRSCSRSVVIMQFALVAISVRLSYLGTPRDWFIRHPGNAMRTSSGGLLLTVWVFQGHHRRDHWRSINMPVRMTLDIHWRN